MLSHCLKCKKIQKTYTKEFQKRVILKKCYYRNVLSVVVKNQDLLRNKKQVDYYVVSLLKHH